MNSYLFSKYFYVKTVSNWHFHQMTSMLFVIATIKKYVYIWLECLKIVNNRQIFRSKSDMMQLQLLPFFKNRIANCNCNLSFFKFFMHFSTKLVGFDTLWIEKKVRVSLEVINGCVPMNGCGVWLHLRDDVDGMV